MNLLIKQLEEFKHENSYSTLVHLIINLEKKFKEFQKEKQFYGISINSNDQEDVMKTNVTFNSEFSGIFQRNKVTFSHFSYIFIIELKDSETGFNSIVRFETYPDLSTFSHRKFNFLTRFVDYKIISL